MDRDDELFASRPRARARPEISSGALPRDAPDVGTGEAGTLDDGHDDADSGARGSERRADRGGGVQGVRLQRGDCERQPGDRAVAGRDASTTARALEPLAVVAELELPIERAHVAALAVEAAQARD